MRINQGTQMEPYRNFSGDSSVMSYKTGDDFIEIKFYPTTSLSRTNYRFTYESAGKENVEKMKDLAREGRGLNHFVKFSARDLYERKWQDKEIVELNTLFSQFVSSANYHVIPEIILSGIQTKYNLRQ